MTQDSPNNTIQHRILNTLNKGKLSKSVLTMTVRDQPANSRRLAYDKLLAAGLLEEGTVASPRPGRNPIIVRITDKGRVYLKDLQKEQWT